ncbi:pilus assembly PilX family protein [Delftia sp. PS-11]|uniref:pilus assembly PilX family protein n=1 Tax=Delftia sp. PS-11 TaxID=2767222 RepID=UPI002457B0B9|nr:hypothetical protein [Delftia sp. PS-11]KAJ8745492.1 pilus assembly protein [Delftia sp. PS-11]
MTTPTLCAPHPSRWDLPPRGAPQQGIVLIAAMLCLLAVVALPLVTMDMELARGRPGGKDPDLEMARQAAEAALNSGERHAAALATASAAFDHACTAGLCLPPKDGRPWGDALKARPELGIPIGSRAEPPLLWSGSTPPPRYLIEKLEGSAGIRERQAYHVIAIGEGQERRLNGRPSSQVVLESLYIP